MILPLALLLALQPVGAPLGRGRRPGDLDPTFGSGGKVTTDFAGGSDVAIGVALQPDGKIVAAGSATPKATIFSDFALARYNSDGSMDATFGSAGKVTTDFGGDGDRADSVALQLDGKIVAAGTTSTPGVGGFSHFALARYNSDGSLDATFGSGGKVITDFGGGAEAVALQPDGKIVAAGSASPGATIFFDFALARYNPDGSLDATFGSGGKVTTEFTGGSDRASAVALQPDGKIVAAGTAFTGTSYNVALARYKPDGSLDATFGSGGKVTTEFTGNFDQANAVALQPNGKIVAAGNTGAGTSHDFALARYNPDGSLDATFGSGGKVTTDFTGGSDQATALSLQPNGKIVAAGTASTGTILEFALVRYKKHGGLDPSFGSGGKVTTDFTGSNDVAWGVALQPDRKIVAVGGAGTVNSDFALARYLVE
jgi:uncharacterized delta-60 repeat protein